MLKNNFSQIQQGQQARAFNADQFAGQEMPQFTPEQGQAARQEIMAALREANLNLDLIVEMGRYAEQVIQDPQQFERFQAWLKSQGLPDSEIPDDMDITELAGMAAVGKTAESMLAEQGVSSEAELAPTGGVSGPISPEQLEATAAAGRSGDTMLAHINAEEAAVLKQMGGTGAINPETGLPEFNFFSDLWNGFKNVVKKVAPVILPVVGVFFPTLLPAIGSFLLPAGASAALSGAVGAAVLSGGITAISGGSVKDVLKSAAFTGLGSYLTPIVGKYASDIVGVTSPTLQTVIGSGIVAGGFTAARGGNVSQILTAAATGAAASYLGQIANQAINGTPSGVKVTNAKATQQAFDDATFAAADAKSMADMGLSRAQIQQVLQQSGLNSTSASTAASLASSGAAAGDIAAKLTNIAGSAKTLYSNNKTGVDNSLVGGGNAKALEMVQAAEDAKMIAQDAKNLKALGLSAAAIQQNLEAAGVPADVAKYAAQNALSTNLETSLTTNYYNKGVNLFSDSVTAGTTERAIGGELTAKTQSRMDSAEMVAADVKQQLAQGLSLSQIKANLIASGVSPDVATVATYSSSASLSQAELTAKLVGNANLAKFDDLYHSGPMPVTPAPAPGGKGEVAKPIEPVSPDSQARLDDAAMIAADAKGMKAQGLGFNDIKANLIASGVDPTVADYTARYINLTEAQLAAGIVKTATTANVADLYKPPSAPVAPVEPAKPTTPVSDTGGPVQVNNITSTGYSDSAPGTVFNGPNGPEVVLASGKTVLLSDYQAAIDSGQPVSVDGIMPTSGTIRIQIIGSPLLADSLNVPKDLQIPEGYRLATSVEANQGLAGEEAVTLPDGRQAWLIKVDPNATLPELPLEGGQGGGGQGPGAGGTGGGTGSDTGGAGGGTVTPVSPGGDTTVTPIEPGSTAPSTPTPGVPSGVGQYTVDGNTVSIMPDGTQIIDYSNGATLMISPDGVQDYIPPSTVPTAPTAITAPIQNPDGTTTTYYNNGSTQITYPGGTTVSLLPDGTQIVDSPDGSTSIYYPDGGVDVVGGTGTGTGGTGTGTGTGGTGTGTGTGTGGGGTGTGTGGGGTGLIPGTGGETGITPGTGGETGITPVTPTEPVIPVTPEPPVPPVEPPVPPVEPPVPPVEPPVTPPEPPVIPEPPVVPPYIPTPIPPIVPPDQPPLVDGGGYTLRWGTPAMPQTRFGLNPGLMQAVPQYQTTSPVQSQFFWGGTPFQTGGVTGQEFSNQVAQSSPYAPATPWGLQQMFTPQSGQDVMAQLLAGQNPYATVLPVTNPR